MILGPPLHDFFIFIKLYMTDKDMDATKQADIWTYIGNHLQEFSKIGQCRSSNCFISLNA